jgi:hypothetical protein
MFVSPARARPLVYSEVNCSTPHLLRYLSARATAVGIRLRRRLSWGGIRRTAAPGG